jgi:uncharacterized membrane protein YfcA
MCLVQLPLQIGYGIMTANTALLGLFALVPLAIAMPIGEWIGKKFSAQLFDMVSLVFLTALAVKLLFDVV